MIDLMTAVRAATTGPIQCYGFQIVDGVLLAVGDLVMVKDQEDPMENGIYVVSDENWVLMMPSFDCPIIRVTYGNENGSRYWSLVLYYEGVFFQRTTVPAIDEQAGRDEPPEAQSLTFDALRGAHRARIPTYRNKKGERIYKTETGDDWALSQWSNALAGEVGEAANLIKKIERGDFTLDEARAELAKELADIASYVDLLANRAGIDLGEAVIGKFNEVSERVGSPVRLRPQGHYQKK